jgi:hypothetical protein
MLPATMPALLAQLTRRRRARRAQEPADMGTAFGMEQWLDSCATAPAPAASRARRSWLPRWLRSATR